MKVINLSLLMCVAVTPLSPVSAQEIIEYGDFLATTSVDDFDGRDNSLAATFDDENDGLLGWKCMSDGMNVIIDLGKYQGGDDDNDIRVRWKFDGGEIYGGYWRLFSDQESAWMRLRHVPEFTMRAKGATSMMIETVDPLDGERNIYSFSMMGLSDALGHLPCYTG